MLIEEELRKFKGFFLFKATTFGVLTPIEDPSEDFLSILFIISHCHFFLSSHILQQ
jgi:hypothetical protein